jgi:hypothetical protein
MWHGTGKSEALVLYSTESKFSAREKLFMPINLFQIIFAPAPNDPNIFTNSEWCSYFHFLLSAIPSFPPFNLPNYLQGIMDDDRKNKDSSSWD